MGRKKRYCLKCINFGTDRSYARHIVEQYLKRHGSVNLSRLIRKLVVIYFREDPDYREARRKLLVSEKEWIADQIRELSKQLHAIDDTLAGMGCKGHDIII